MSEPPILPREFGRYLMLAQVGIEFVSPLVIGLFADHYLGWTPWGTVTGAVLGLVGGMTHLVVLLNRQDKEPPPRP